MHITYPFSIDARGKVAATQSPQKVWRDRVRAVVSTQVGDRVMRPDFGLDSLSSVLNVGTPAEKTLEEQIRDAFINFLPRLTLLRAAESFDPSSGVIEVDLVFTSPDSTETTMTLALPGSGSTTDYTN